MIYNKIKPLRYILTPILLLFLFADTKGQIHKLDTALPLTTAASKNFFILQNSKNLKNFPFKFGFQFGSSIDIKGKSFLINGYWVFVNLNIYDKRILVRSEFGALKLNEELGGDAAKYFFLGFLGVPVVYKQHKLSLSLGLSYYSSKPQYGIGFAGSVEYTYMINRYFSVTTGIKFPSIRKAIYDEYFYNPMLTIGFQIF